MKVINIFKLMIIAFILSSFGVAEEVKVDRIYPYIFAESTGDNKFTICDKSIKPIRRFALDSNMESVNTLMALRYNVIYPNSDGTKIFLRGEYNIVDSSFRLTGWFIVSPFVSRDVVDVNKLPQEYKTVKRVNLVADDFRIPVTNLKLYVRTIE
ncbi:hypothetical protein JIN85_06270 [Luteolibacter pohnpeiensis]|uniref:Uncharacterized protein n=1 Tax=Luteolibacter pohnpeiensis TaxID=454153 RepID=A0A934S994_9BACT|nr:hypothetical protein [Luteolibacter pohnpeiensis]MBK1882012.1 hypothetical protein [Luteolibacter pohnpeiensis]